MKKIELLAPCGNRESLEAAVTAGCDAVYLGLTTFSARAFAGNFTHEEFIDAIQYCHIRNVKVYVTMNTLLFETEIDNAIQEVQFLYENDVDALLIQDLGLFHAVREMFPDLEVHASTQMHIHNIDGARFMQKQGASRVVLARETPLSIVKDISSLGIETEVFVYGAICISYSGQCLMSESVKNRSGNRGMCAQMCRLKYYSDHKEDGEYLLSPKDLNVIDKIPELIEAGVSSLKIEGRMKRKEYVYLVVKTFREAIDAYYENKAYTVSKQRQNDLLLMFNRGFSFGHLFHATTNERMSHYRPNHRGITIGKVLDFKNYKVKVKLSYPLYQHDGLRILNEPVDTGLTAVKIYKNGLLVNKADIGDIVELDCKSKPYPKKGQLLQKTSDAHLLEVIDKEIEQNEKRVALTCTYQFIANKHPILIMKDERGNEVSMTNDSIVQTATNAPLSKDRIINQIKKVGNEPYYIEACDGIADNIFLPVSTINQLRRDALIEMSKHRSMTHVRIGKQDYTWQLAIEQLPNERILLEKNENILAYRKDSSIFYTKLYPIQENGYHEDVLENCVISEVGTLDHKLENVYVGMNLNIANSYACAFLLQLKGIRGIILSSEIRNEQIEIMIKHFEERYGFEPPVYKLVYGRRTIMYIKNGFTDHMNDIHEFTDLHDLVFPIKQHENVTEILENEPYRSLNPYCYGSYIIITEENDRIVQEIKGEAYEEIFERV